MFLQFLSGVLVKAMLFTELLSQLVGLIPLEYDDTLRFVLTEVYVNEQEGSVTILDRFFLLLLINFS